MKILLIQPPFTIFKTESKKCHPPLGLAYLAAVLRGKYEIIILDALAEGYEYREYIDKESLRYGLPFEKIKDRIVDLRPDIVGISCPFSTQWWNAHSICQIVKEIDRNIITILGGAHPSTLPQQTLEDKDVDFVIIGEGENTILRLLNEIERKSDPSDIDGLAYRQDSQIRINPYNSFIDNLDSLPFPDWNIFPLEKYFKINNPHGSPARKSPFIPMITSRGCPFECIFCSIHNIWGREYRKRSVENVLSELNYLRRNFGVKEILFEDDNLTLDKHRAKQIFKNIIDMHLDIYWSTPNGVAIQTLDNEMLSLMRDSGCYSISVGIESGDADILNKLIRKPIDLSCIRPVINKAKRLDMETTAFFVVGFPGETKRQLENTFRFAKRINVDNVNFFFATPLPGTRLLELCKKNGFINGELDYRRLNSDNPLFSTNEFSISELKSAVKRQRLILYVRLLLKNPKLFFNKLFVKLLRDPGYFIRFRQRYLNA